MFVRNLFFLFCFLYIVSGVFAQNIKDQTTGQALTIQQHLAQSDKYLADGMVREATFHLNQAATIYWERKELQQAIDLFERSIELNKTIDNQQGILGISSNLAMIYADLKQYETSLKYFQTTLEGRRKGKDKVSIISGLINTAVVLNNLKKHNEAAKLLEEALDLAREMNDAQQMRSCYGMLAETYEKAGNLEKTLHYFELYRSFHEMVNRETVSKANKQTEEARLRSTLLEKEKRIAELEVQAQQVQIQEKEQVIANKEEVIKTKDKNLQSLIDSNSKAELALKYTREQAEVQRLAFKERNSRQQLALEKSRQKTLIFIIVAIAMAILGGLAIWASLKFRKQRERLALQKRHLQKQREQLRETNAVKDRLFSIIAHDLRTPFNNLQATLQLVKEGVIKQQDLGDFMSSLQRLMYGTTQTLDTLLQWARSQMGGFTTKPVAFRLKDVTQEVVDLYTSQAADKGIRLQHKIADDCVVLGDVEQIKLVIRNLTGNALKFTSRDGSITLSARRKGPDYNISVADTGVGMATDALKNLSNQIQFTTRGTDQEKGTGLGLMMCRDFLEKNSSELQVESMPGQGTTFMFMLPSARLKVSKTTPPVVSALSTEDKIPPLLPQALQEDMPELKTMTVLVADDDPMNRLWMKKICQKTFGSEPTIVKDGQQAVEAYQKQQYDIVILDLQMPLLDGFEATQIILNEGAEHKPVVFILTASDDPHDAQTALEKGAAKLLVKPVNANQLKKYAEEATGIVNSY